MGGWALLVKKGGSLPPNNKASIRAQIAYITLQYLSKFKHKLYDDFVVRLDAALLDLSFRMIMRDCVGATGPGSSTSRQLTPFRVVKSEAIVPNDDVRSNSRSFNQGRVQDHD